MFGIRVIPILLVCVLLVGCHKENGKHDYEMRLLFDSGDVFTSIGTIAENKLKRRRGQELIVHPGILALVSEADPVAGILHHGDARAAWE